MPTCIPTLHVWVASGYLNKGVYTKLMFTLRDDYLTLNRIVTENYQYIRWCDEPLRKTGMDKSSLVKVNKGIVMPKNWIR